MKRNMIAREDKQQSSQWASGGRPAVSLLIQTVWRPSHGTASVGLASAHVARRSGEGRVKLAESWGCEGFFAIPVADPEHDIDRRPCRLPLVFLQECSVYTDAESIHQKARALTGPGLAPAAAARTRRSPRDAVRFITLPVASTEWRPMDDRRWISNEQPP